MPFVSPFGAAKVHGLGQFEALGVRGGKHRAPQGRGLGRSALAQSAHGQVVARGQLRRIALERQREALRGCVDAPFAEQAHPLLDSLRGGLGEQFRGRTQALRVESLRARGHEMRQRVVAPAAQ